MRDLHFNEGLRNDTYCAATQFEHTICNDTHQPDIRSAIDKLAVPLDDRLGEISCSIRIVTTRAAYGPESSLENPRVPS